MHKFYNLTIFIYKHPTSKSHWKLSRKVKIKFLPFSILSIVWWKDSIYELWFIIVGLNKTTPIKYVQRNMDWKSSESELNQPSQNGIGWVRAEFHASAIFSSKLGWIGLTQPSYLIFRPSQASFDKFRTNSLPIMYFIYINLGLSEGNQVDLGAKWEGPGEKKGTINIC